MRDARAYLPLQASQEEKTVDRFRTRLGVLFRNAAYATALLLPLFVAACSKGGGSGY